MADVDEAIIEAVLKPIEKSAPGKDYAACYFKLKDAIASERAARVAAEEECERMRKTLFDELTDSWERNTRNVSSPTVIAGHPAARKIIAMGKPVVPLILRRMEHHPWFWFSALRELTGEDPTTPSMRGNMQALTDAWLQWGAALAGAAEGGG